MIHSEAPVLHTLQNEYLSITVSELGAELQSILSADGTQYLWQGDPAYWKGRAIHLFPYVGRLTNGSYILDGRQYSMDHHGFARFQQFQLIERMTDRLTFELTDSAETFASYPRKFAFRVIYGLKDHALEITYEVENRDSRIMYFGLGGHPGFRVPLANGKTFEDYRLRFHEPCKPRRICFTPDRYLDGTEQTFPLEGDSVLPLKHELFDSDAIVLKNAARQVTLEAQGDHRAVTVVCPQMPYLGIWHMPGTDAPYVCIEPWCSLPSKQDEIADLSIQPDLLSLKPHMQYRNMWYIFVSDTLHGKQ